MNFLSARYLFPQKVDVERTVTTRTFGSVKEVPTVVASDLPCSIQTAPDSEVLQFGGQGADAVVSVLFPERPDVVAGDVLLGKGLDVGRDLVVKMLRPAAAYKALWWVCDCTERT